MDRIGVSTDATTIRDPVRPTPAEDFALPSRGAALANLRLALEAQAGPLLVTGEPGVGKSWLCRRLQAGLPRCWRVVQVDIPPGIGPAALYDLIGHRLGLPCTAGAEPARRATWDFLREATTDGVRWALVLDEAHNASAALLEEIRVLTNRLGAPDGFSALILVGQTSLARRLAAGPLRALATRIATHVHLLGLDVEEARTLIGGLAAPVHWDDRTLERHHRDVAGNPRRLLLAAARASTPYPPPPLASPARLRDRPGVSGPIPMPDLNLDPGTQEPATPPTPTPLENPAPVANGPYKPPLLVGDGMVEVGWEGGPDTQPEVPSSPTPSPPRGEGARRADEGATWPASARPESEPAEGTGAQENPGVEMVETLDDHYAALQAWNEWARNRQRCADFLAEEASGEPLDPASATEDAPGVAGRAGIPGTGQPSVWVEGEQGFAPYGQLFSRLRQSRDVNESG